MNVIDQTQWDANYSEAKHLRLIALWNMFVERDTNVDCFTTSNELVNLCDDMGVEWPFDLR